MMAQLNSELITGAFTLIIESQPRNLSSGSAIRKIIELNPPIK